MREKNKVGEPEQLQDVPAELQLVDVERENAFGTIIKFEDIGENIIGVYTGKRETMTENGVCNVLRLVNLNDQRGVETEGNFDIFESRFLTGYNWDSMVNKKIYVEYIGLNPTKKGNRKFKEFRVALVK